MTGKVKEYTGSVYIGVVGPEMEYGECRDSIQQMRIRPGDEGPHFIRATKGFEARQMHLNKFIREGKHEFLFLMDHDQTFPPDALERLRSHKLPFVSGYYMRRRYQPIMPVWYEYGPKGKMPMIPMLTNPPRGQLIKLGASGWGCMLVHRDVILAVRSLLKGEPEIIEDDMDVRPYDLGRVMRAIGELHKLAQTQPALDIYPLLREHVQTLRAEIRPLRADKATTIGSDIRFPFFAREAGYDLMGDPDVRCGHALIYPLSGDDYDLVPGEGVDEMRKNLAAELKDEQRKILDARKAVLG